MYCVKPGSEQQERWRRKKNKSTGSFTLQVKSELENTQETKGNVSNTSGGIDQFPKSKYLKIENTEKSSLGEGQLNDISPHLDEPSQKVMEPTSVNYEAISQEGTVDCWAER